MKSKKGLDQDNIWAVRGVSHEARNAAKMAARKSQDSLGSWVSRKILEAAQAELRDGKQEIARQEDVLNILETLSNKFETEVSDLRNQLENVKTQKKSWVQIVFNKAS